ncbi:MAG: glutathione S-transferase N-terminal domain-containing protein [Clostridia bacterium]|nr:glutathione S-transferase N-terminal domain-containing protein [Clostridia bacterium]
MYIKVYSTPSCTYCTALKKYLDEKNISYENIDVSQDRAAAAEMIAKSGQRAIPVIDIDGNIIVGFDRNKLSEILESR